MTASIKDFIDKDCLDKGLYRQSKHAIERERERERNIDLPDVLYVLRNGYHEKQKTTFDEVFETWKYAVRGKTIDESDIRIIIAFDDTGMMIITVMHVVKG
ncbi:MAG: DUF4258 domain-containing protein [Parachlamydiaceae bacterium]|nr:DUF4258 domain-containing protein [Parachlamydiaceae bacterium]